MLVEANDKRTQAMSPVEVRDLPLRILGDEHRVILLPFGPGDKPQAESIFDFVSDQSDDEVESELARVMVGFENRHRDFRTTIRGNYESARGVVDRHIEDVKRQLLAGAYLTMEYAFQAAALFNPSIVPHPNQEGVADGALRFVMSLRAVGEGHVSSVVFHTGTVNADDTVAMDKPSSTPMPSRTSPDKHYLKALFRRTLNEMGVQLTKADQILKKVPAEFTLADLDEAIALSTRAPSGASRLHSTVESIRWLARSNYELRLPPEASIDQLLFFPNSDNESRGIEDLRMVQFQDDEHASYYGTYTAFNGERILPMLIETEDFRTIAVHTLNGHCAQNKGMALFPKKIDGHYAMCARIDGRSLYLMYSDYVHFWESATILAKPKYSWEYRIIGNCGSPLETDEGWLLITHGVGPMRQYSIGAMLLDLEDPFKIRGRLKKPLICPTEEERSGYVPNVVYSCGSLIWNERLILPYAISDRKTAMASVDLQGLVDQLIKDGE